MTRYLLSIYKRPPPRGSAIASAAVVLIAALFALVAPQGELPGTLEHGSLG